MLQDISFAVARPKNMIPLERNLSLKSGSANLDGKLFHSSKGKVPEEAWQSAAAK